MRGGLFTKHFLEDFDKLLHFLRTEFYAVLTKTRLYPKHCRNIRNCFFSCAELQELNAKASKLFSFPCVTL